MDNSVNRRGFLKAGALALGGMGLGLASCKGVDTLFGGGGGQKGFSISLAQWSLHRTLGSGNLDNLDFAKKSKEAFGIDAIEYVNSFFKDKAGDKAYLDQLNSRAGDLGVRQVLIMVDGEGNLGEPDKKLREQAVDNHKKWVEAAAHIGCHSIRVNARSKGTYEEQMELAADGARRLVEFAASMDINVIVENHGGLSSNGEWLAGLMRAVGSPRFGTLPDFGNFYDYDRYQGVGDLMPFAKAVSAKSYDFDEKGNETKIDYPRMMKIVLDAGYHGYVGIEYEGKRLPEDEGIRATKHLLERIREDLCG